MKKLRIIIFCLLFILLVLLSIRVGQNFAKTGPTGLFIIFAFIVLVGLAGAAFEHFSKKNFDKPYKKWFFILIAWGIIGVLLFFTYISLLFLIDGFTF